MTSCNYISESAFFSIIFAFFCFLLIVSPSYNKSLYQEFEEELTLNFLNSKFKDELLVACSLSFNNEKIFIGFTLTWFNDFNKLETFHLNKIDSYKDISCFEGLLNKLSSLKFDNRKNVVLLLYEKESSFVNLILPAHLGHP